jgi:hypothetical protein
MANNTTKSQKYRGPGELTSALGSSSKWSMIGTLFGGVGSYWGAKTLISENGPMIAKAAAEGQKALAASGLDAQTVSQLSKYYSPAYLKSGIVATAAVSGALVLGLIGGGYGLFNGWSKASKARKDHKSLASENAMLKAQAEVLQNVYAAGNAKWTDRVNASRQMTSELTR